MKCIAPAIKLFSGRAKLAIAAALVVGGLSCQNVGAAKIEGLDGLDDRALGAELSSRGIGNLLDYYFKSKNVPLSDQQAMKTVGALTELGKADSKIPYGELRRVREVADGIDAVLPTLKNPADMMQTAATIAEFGVNQDVNSLEYWGEDPMTQKHLKPLSSALVKLFAQASKVATKRADEMSHMDLNNQKNANAWEAMDTLAHTAEYTRNMSVYFDVIATSPKVFVDPANKNILTPEEAEKRSAAKLPMLSLRKSLAEDAINALNEFDNPDSSVQPRIRNMLGKLYMSEGEYKKAKDKFFSNYSDKSDTKPAPNAFEQYEARYFNIVTELQSGDLASAGADKQTLDAWQKEKLPALFKATGMDDAAIKKADDGISAAGEMLQWRIFVLTADLAQNADAKKIAESNAETVLLRLKAAHPELASRIDQQLVNRFPANKVVDDSVPSSVLLALVKKGLNESAKSESEKIDEAVLKKAITAAEVIIKNKDRKDAKGASEFTPQNISETKLAIAELQDRLGNDVEAADRYLTFAIEERGRESKKSEEAFDRCGYLIFAKMGKSAAKPKGYEALYNKFLPVAIDTFHRTTLAPLYAEQLRERKEYELAVRYYRMVTKDSPTYTSVDYKVMLCLGAMLDPDSPKKLDEATRKSTTAELKKVATVVKKLGVSPKDNVDRSRAIAATLALADLARTEKNAKEMIDVLNGFDPLVDGLTVAGKTQPEQDALAKKKKELKRGAKAILVRAMMQQGDINGAVQQVQQLLKDAQNQEGIAMVRELIDKLENDYDAAKAKVPQDIDGMREARKNGSQLTGFLVDYANPAKGQTNPKVAEYYYAYAVYDARMQREAGTLAATPEEKKALWAKARKSYEELQSPKMKQLYLNQPDVKQQIADGQRDKDDPDPTVAAGLALTTYDLGDYKVSHELLMPLVQQKKFGPPQIDVKDSDGNQKTDEKGNPIRRTNKVYWEGMYDYLKSGAEISKADPTTMSIVVTDLKNILIRGGIPAEYEAQFEVLRKTLAPDFNPNVIAAQPLPATPTTKPATTQPVSSK